MRRFHQSADTKKDDAIVVRVFGDSLDFFTNRTKEFLAMQIAYAAGCFQPILAVFKNGVAYKYAHGRTLRYADLSNPKVIKTVTRKLAQLHTIDIDSVPLVDANGEKGVFDKSTDFEKQGAELMDQYQDTLPDPE